MYIKSTLKKGDRKVYENHPGISIRSSMENLYGTKLIAEIEQITRGKISENQAGCTPNRSGAEISYLKKKKIENLEKVSTEIRTIESNACFGNIERTNRKKL